MEKTKADVKSYRDLVVWQLGVKLAKEIYTLTAKFPRHEVYGLADQLRRASVSIPSNIAEGQARRSVADFRRYLFIALGSLAELDTQLVLAQEFGYLTTNDIAAVNDLILELRKKIHTLINNLPNQL
jgi:four helix bundle protein